MTVTLPTPKGYDEKAHRLFEKLVYMPDLFDYEEYQEFLRYVDADPVILEQLVVEYLKQGATGVAQEVLEDIDSPHVDLVRAVTIIRSRELNRDVHPLFIPAETWNSPFPTLFNPTWPYEEWYAGRVEFIMEGEVTLRVRHLKDTKETYGTLIVAESRFPRPAEAGDYVEAVKEAGTWEIRFHDMSRPPLENPYL